MPNAHWLPKEAEVNVKSLIKLIVIIIYFRMKWSIKKFQEWPQSNISNEESSNFERMLRRISHEIQS